jgi:putative ABC transport system substrate-binding protein
MSLLLIAILVVASVSGCKKESNDKYKIGVIQIVEHPSLNTIRDSFSAQMKELGFIDGENSEFEYKDAQNDMTTAISIIQSFEADEKDIIIAITTPAAQAAAPASENIPVVFSAVTDPVGPGFVDSLESTGKNMTGTSDALDIDKILDLALTLTPNIKKLGYIYNSGEPNSVSCLETVNEYAAANGIEVVASAITNSSELQQASQVLVTKVDAIFTPNDNTVALGMQILAKVAKDAKIPVYVGADSMVADGGFATVGIEYTDLGKETANMAAKILKGEAKASEIPVKVFNEDLSTYINPVTAQAIGVTIPDSILNGDKTKLLGE